MVLLLSGIMNLNNININNNGRKGTIICNDFFWPCPL